MLSTFPATLCPDPYPYPPFQTGVFPLENQDPSFLFNDQISPPEPVISSNSGSDTPSPGPVSPKSGSDEPDPKRKKTDYIKSGSTPNDERKRKRVISNRESARRSRVRKQRHLENLMNRLTQLQTGNREIMNRVQLLVHQNQYVRTENESLQSEAASLRQRLWDIRQVLLVRQLQQHLNPSAWPRNNVNEGLLLLNHSLIT